MTTAELQNEIYYKMALGIINKMLQKDLITEDEFKKIDRLNRETFKPGLVKIMP